MSSSSGLASQLPPSLAELPRLVPVSSVTWTVKELLPDSMQPEVQEQLLVCSELGVREGGSEGGGGGGDEEGRPSWVRMELYGGGGVVGLHATSS